MKRASSVRAAAWAVLVALGPPLAAPAAHALEQIEGAYEAALVEVVLPASTRGYVVVPPCSTCRPESLAVDADTAYVVARTAVPYADFARAAAALVAAGRGRSAAVYVFYDLETTRVTRLVLDDLEV